MVRVRVVIHGRVQGVWFRASTKEVASTLGLGGWVRNLPTGEVEAVFEGERSAVDEMLSWCGKGPSASRVDRVDAAEEKPEGLTAPFEVRY